MTNIRGKYLKTYIINTNLEVSDIDIYVLSDKEFFSSLAKDIQNNDVVDVYTTKYSLIIEHEIENEKYTFLVTEYFFAVRQNNEQLISNCTLDTLFFLDCKISTICEYDKQKIRQRLLLCLIE